MVWTSADGMDSIITFVRVPRGTFGVEAPAEAFFLVLWQGYEMSHVNVISIT